jgi:hypothetical protein
MFHTKNHPHISLNNSLPDMTINISCRFIYKSVTMIDDKKIISCTVMIYKQKMLLSRWHGHFRKKFEM